LIRRRAEDRDRDRAQRDADHTRAAQQQHQRRVQEGPRRDRYGAHGAGAGRITHRMRLPAHTASSRVLATWYPWIMDPGLGVPGAYIGVDLYSRASFLFDPWELYRAGTITSPNGLIIGEIGSGKSALNKSLIVRFAAVGIPFSWVDIKDEYSDLADALGIEPLRLGPGLGVQLNPLAAPGRHPEQTEAEWRGAIKGRRLSLLEGIIHVRLGRALSMTERTAIELALDAATGQMPGLARDQLAPASLPAVVAKMTAVEEWDDELRERGITATQLLDESRDARLALHNLVGGALAGMFDATEDTSRYLDFDAAGTIVNLAAIRRDQAVTVMAMVCAQSAMEAALMRPGARQRMVGYDEAWLPMRYVPLLRRFQEQWKLARLYGIFNVLTAHRVSDWDAVGDAGSEAARLARGLLEDTGVRIAYRQVEASLPATRDLFGLTDVQTALLRYLRKGSAMWLLGQRAFVVQHLLSSVEHPLVQTDSRMRAAAGVDDVPDEEWERLLDSAHLLGGA
jgi:type IV secretory pathway VirB4 component